MSAGEDVQVRRNLAADRFEIVVDDVVAWLAEGAPGAPPVP